MKKIGDLLSAIIDEKMLHQAQGYSELFHSWSRLTKKYGIAAAADHSRIRDVERNILLVEADHPGWIQILQTKEHKLLADLQLQFSDLAITGISFRLSRAPLQRGEKTEAGPDESAAAISAAPLLPEAVSPEEKKTGYERIKDEKLRASLKSLEKSIIAGRRNK
jgi:hypothetical protein